MTKEQLHVIEMIKKVKDTRVLSQIENILIAGQAAQSKMPQRLIDQCREDSKLYDLGLLETIPRVEVHAYLLKKTKQ